MAVRTGMSALILRLRSMTEAGSTEYTVDGVQYWTDQQLQDVLDQHVEVVRVEAIQPEYEFSGGATVWKDYPTGYDALEAVASGAPFWSLTDSTGVEVTGSLYVLDQNTGIIRFTADQAGVIYFLTARNYDMAGAAADIWRRKMSHAFVAYDFSTEGQSFSRSQMFDHAQQMATTFSRQGGFKTVEMWRSDLL